MSGNTSAPHRTGDPSMQYSSGSSKPTVKELMHKRGVHSDFTDVILWHKPVITGGILGGVSLIYVVFQILELNFLATMLFISFVGLTGLFAWSKVAELTKLSGPTVPSFLRHGVSGTDNEPKLIHFVKGTIIPYSDRFCGVIYQVIAGKDVVQAGSVLGGLLAASWIVNRVNPLTVTFLSILLLFTVPKIYEYKQDDIDHYIGLGHQKVRHYYNQGTTQANKAYNDLSSRVQAGTQGTQGVKKDT